MTKESLMEGVDEQDELLQAAIQLSLQEEAEQLRLMEQADRAGSSGSKRSHESASDAAERSSRERAKPKLSPDVRRPSTARSAVCEFAWEPR